MEATDTTAVKSPLRTYWSGAGWKPDPDTPADELERAIAAGVMFREAREADHDDLIGDVRRLAASIDVGQAAHVFVRSLHTRRRPDMRSALASVIVGRHLPEHRFTPHPGESSCAVCGLYETQSIDRNVLNFERFKWGGVRRLDLGYVWHDLEIFQPADLSGSDATGDNASHLLEELAQAPPDMTAAHAAVKLMRGVASNEEERRVILEILGVCSILPTPEYPGFKDAFVPANERPLPPQRFVDLSYPVCWWRGENGIDRDAAVEVGLV